MPILDVSHQPLLAALACFVALVAGFAGLTLTRNLSARTELNRKICLALAAISLGGGIWSMHFVAMLGLQMPVPYFYDAAITLASALIAILMVGLALTILHYVPRTRATILASGAVVGLGVLAMHYVGMSGLRLCRAVYTGPGLALSSAVGIALCMLAVWVAYRRRRDRDILLGTVCFGLAVSSVHFLAMATTGFEVIDGAATFGPAMSNEVLAIGVILSSFVLLAACIWVGTVYLAPPSPPQSVQPSPAPVAAAPAAPPAAPPPPAPKAAIPCEKDGARVLLGPAEVAFVRADGHYTQVYTESDRLFCSWPIAETARRLVPQGFLQTHRSYLVNPRKIARFERSKDKGRCTFHEADLPPVPVSRSKLKLVEAHLAEELGATGAP